MLKKQQEQNKKDLKTKESESAIIKKNLVALKEQLLKHKSSVA